MTIIKLMSNTKSLLKISILGFGFMALFAPSCRAQQEIDPDHFDGTDSWALAAARKAPPAKSKFSAVATHLPARRGGPATTSDLSKARPQSVALNDRRKGSSRQSSARRDRIQSSKGSRGA
jgi:hypothetical protein